jgi:hypothetical protein
MGICLCAVPVILLVSFVLDFTLTCQVCVVENMYLSVTYHCAYDVVASQTSSIEGLFTMVLIVYLCILLTFESSVNRLIKEAFHPKVQPEIPCSSKVCWLVIH